MLNLIYTGRMEVTDFEKVENKLVKIINCYQQFEPFVSEKNEGEYFKRVYPKEGVIFRMKSGLNFSPKLYFSLKKENLGNLKDDYPDIIFRNELFWENHSKRNKSFRDIFLKMNKDLLSFYSKNRLKEVKRIEEFSNKELNYLPFL